MTDLKEAGEKMLKPCPCCPHGKGRMRTSHDEDGLLWVWIECDGCNVRTHGNGCRPENDCPQFRQERRDEWNRRINAPEVDSVRVPSADEIASLEYAADLAIDNIRDADSVDEGVRHMNNLRSLATKLRDLHDGDKR